MKNFLIRTWRILPRPSGTALTLGIIGLLLYLPGIFWGLPEGLSADRVAPWGHDTITPLSPLAEFYNTFVSSDPTPFLGYPLMHHMLLVVFYAPYMVLLLLTGGLAQPNSIFPFGLTAPDESLPVLTLIGRGVSLLMAAGIIAAAYETGRVLWDRLTGMVAAVFVMMLYPMFYYSHTGNLDVPYMFWGALAFLVFAVVLRGRFTVREGIALGVLAALATGTKDQAAAMFLLLPFIILPLHWRDHAPRAQRGGRSFWTPPLATVISGAIAYAISSGFVFGPERYINHVLHILGIGEMGISLPNYPQTAAGYFALARETAHWIIVSMGWPMVVVALVGMTLAAAHDRRAFAFGIPALSLLFTFIIPVRFVELRYVLPITIILAFFAAYAVCLGLRSSNSSVRAISVLALIAILIVQISKAAGLTYEKLYDSRYAAAAWIMEYAAPGDRIGYFGPNQKLPRIGPEYEYVRVVEFTGTRPVNYTRQDIQEMAESVLSSGARFILIIPDHSLQPGMPYGNTAPNELLDQLRDGSLGYRPVARFLTKPMLSFAPRPLLADYSIVNPEVEVLERRIKPLVLRLNPVTIE